jgi:hypothetical protein
VETTAVANTDRGAPEAGFLASLPGALRRLNYPETTLVRLVIGAFVVVSVLGNVKLSEQLHLNTFYAAAFIYVSMLVWLGRSAAVPRLWPSSFLIALCFALYLTVNVYRSLGQPWFVSESVKIMLLLMLALSYRALDPCGASLRVLMTTIACVVLLACFMQLPGYDLTRLSDRYRFEFLEFGSYNALGMVLGTNITMMLFVTEGSWKRWWLWAFIVADLFFLLITLSRGGLVVLMVSTGVYFFVQSKGAARKLFKPVLYYGFAAAVLAGFVHYLFPTEIVGRILVRFDPSYDPTGSGRLILWSALLERLFANPFELVFGAGIGSINVFLVDHFQRSGHNAYMDILYYSGAIGVAAYLFVLAAIGRAVSRAGGPLKAIRMGLLAGIAAVGMVDSFWNTGQLLWYVAFLFYVVTLKEAPARPAGVRG